MSAEKRPSDPENAVEGDDSEGWIGPLPSEAAQPKPKKRKGKFYLIAVKQL